jgi:hypothetical protein
MVENKKSQLPAEEVNIECSSALAGGSCSPLTVGINASNASIGVSLYDWENTTIGDNTTMHDMKNELIKMLDDGDANEVGGGGLSSWGQRI